MFGKKRKNLEIKKLMATKKPEGISEFLCRPVMEPYGIMVIVLVVFVVVGLRIGSSSSCMIIDY